MTRFHHKSRGREGRNWPGPCDLGSWQMVIDRAKHCYSSLRWRRSAPSPRICRSGNRLLRLAAATSQKDATLSSKCGICITREGYAKLALGWPGRALLNNKGAYCQRYRDRVMAAIRSTRTAARRQAGWWCAPWISFPVNGSFGLPTAIRGGYRLPKLGMTSTSPLQFHDSTRRTATSVS